MRSKIRQSKRKIVAPVMAHGGNFFFLFGMLLLYNKKQCYVKTFLNGR